MLPFRIPPVADLCPHTSKHVLSRCHSAREQGWNRTRGILKARHRPRMPNGWHPLQDLRPTPALLWYPSPTLHHPRPKKSGPPPPPRSQRGLSRGKWPKNGLKPPTHPPTHPHTHTPLHFPQTKQQVRLSNGLTRSDGALCGQRRTRSALGHPWPNGWPQSRCRAFEGTNGRRKRGGTRPKCGGSPPLQMVRIGGLPAYRPRFSRHPPPSLGSHEDRGCAGEGLVGSVGVRKCFVRLEKIPTKRKAGESPRQDGASWCGPSRGGLQSGEPTDRGSADASRSKQCEAFPAPRPLRKPTLRRHSHLCHCQ